MIEPLADRYIVAGSGPSLISADTRRLNLDDAIVRVNNFFFEDAYYLGERVDWVQVGGDRWVFPFYAATLKKLLRAGAYAVGAWSCHERHVVSRGKTTLSLPFVPFAHRDSETLAFLTSLIEKYGKWPTTGVLAVLNAYAHGARTITLIGIDLYADTARYGYRSTGHASALAKQPAGQGYNLRFHDPRVDEAVLEFLSRRPDLTLYRASEGVGALDYLPLAPVMGPGYVAQPKAVLQEDWERWAGIWPIEAMRIARRANELRRALKRTFNGTPK